MDERQQGEEFTSDHVWNDLLLLSLAGNKELSFTSDTFKDILSVEQY